MSFLPFISVFAGAAAWFLCGRSAERGARRNMLSDREQLSGELLYERFYGGSDISRDMLLEAWNQVASVLHVDPGRLRPTDKMDDLVAKQLRLETDIDELYFVLDSIAPFSDDMKPFYDINDVVCYLAKALDGSQM